MKDRVCNPSTLYASLPSTRIKQGPNASRQNKKVKIFTEMKKGKKTRSHLNARGKTRKRPGDQKELHPLKPRILWKPCLLRQPIVPKRRSPLKTFSPLKSKPKSSKATTSQSSLQIQKSKPFESKIMKPKPYVKNLSHISSSR